MLFNSDFTFMVNTLNFMDYTVPVMTGRLCVPLVDKTVWTRACEYCLLQAASRENLSSGFQTWSDTDQAVQQQKMLRGLKFWLLEVEGLFYRSSENKGADQLCDYHTPDLCLCFLICKKQVFS